MKEWLEPLRTFINYSTDAIIVTDLSGIVLATNESFMELYGWMQEEIIGNRVLSVPTDLMDETLTVWSEAASGGHVSSRETVRQRKDGTLADVNVTISPIQDRSGNVTALMGAYRDISQHIELRRTLQASENKYRRLTERLQSLITNSPDAECELGLDGSVIHLNAMSEQILGYTSEELEGAAVVSIVADQDKIEANRLFQLAKQGKPQMNEISILHKSGTIVILAVRIIPITETGEVVGVYIIGQDITSQKKAEWRLEGYRQVLAMIATGASLQDIFNAVVEVVEQQSASLCSIMLVDDNNHLRYGAGKSLPEEYITAIDGVPIGPEVGSCGTAAFRKDLVIVTDISTDPLWHGSQDIAIRSGLRSCWSFPIMSSSGELFGTFGMYGQKPTEPLPDDILILETYGKLISIAIERNNKEREIQYLAYSDALTGLPNRRLFLDRISVALHHAHQHNRMAAVMFLDMDRFKTINDSFGHGYGDEVLKIVAGRIQSCIREEDTLARFGGDEFTVLLPEIEDAEEAKDIAKEILASMREPFVVDGYEFRMTTSIGIAFYPGSGSDANALMKNADAAMYASKVQGKNNFKIHMPAMNETAYERLKLEIDLQKAIDEESFYFQYQPRVQIKTGAITSAEALIRWNHPVLGLIPPSDFISLAEETGLIVPLGNWILHAVCTQIKNWKEAGLNPLPVAINVSPQQFQQENFIETIIEVLEQTGLNAERIEIEITETTLMRNEKDAKLKLKQLKELGIKVSVDDFGIGYSTLGFLKNFQIDSLKIDRSFVQDIHEDIDNASIVSAIITLGHVRQLNVVAEGVESDEQLDFLKEQKCDEMQGYLFSRPLSVPAFEAAFLQKPDH